MTYELKTFYKFYETSFTQLHKARQIWDWISQVFRDLMPSHPKRGSVHAYLPLQTSTGLSSSPQLARLGIDLMAAHGTTWSTNEDLSCVRRGGLLRSLSLIPPLGTPDFFPSLRDPSLQRPRQHAGYVYSQVGQPSTGWIPFSTQSTSINVNSCQVVSQSDQIIWWTFCTFCSLPSDRWVW